MRVHRFDPGDMRTRMHQEAFPGEDISDRPEPEEQAVPALVRLIEHGPPSGRYRVSDLLEEVGVASAPERRRSTRDRGRLRFDLPPELEAREPPEARGMPRDGVQLLVATGDGARPTRPSTASPSTSSPATSWW